MSKVRELEGPVHALYHLAIDDEKDKDDARVALEDELEINNPERLLDTVKKHNLERHKHRTYLKTFKYEIEILNAVKLYELGLVC